MPSAGDMILAGELEASIRAYERAGRGGAGWQAALERLQERFPGNAANSNRAVIDRAREVVSVGNRYRRGNADYSPFPGSVPDVRPLERGSTGGGGSTSGGGRQSSFKHVFQVTIRDSRNQGGVYQVYDVSREFDRPLTRQEFEELGQELGQSFANQFLGSLPNNTDPQRLSADVRIQGVYRGF